MAFDQSPSASLAILVDGPLTSSSIDAEASAKPLTKTAKRRGVENLVTLSKVTRFSVKKSDTLVASC